MMTSIKEHFLKLIMKELDSNKSVWNSSKYFYKIKELSIDQRGRIGEHFLRDVFKELNMNVEYVNNNHGDFDLIVNLIKIEVKLATLDLNNKFQHEGIKSSKKWDIIAFVDVGPENLYVTFINKNKFTFDNKRGTFILHGEMRNSHFRGKDNINNRATGAGYKVDFPLKKLIETKTIKDLENSFNNEIEQKNWKH